MSTVLDSLNLALHRAFEVDNNVLLLGEDVLDPYGGAFKVTRGLSSKYPDRVFTTPISEAGIVGVATGMALRGLRPVVEIMFGDFTTLITDQLVNHATKFRWMYNDQARVPLVIRTPMGGRRGYGPTHSQTLEKLFLGVPGLQVIAPCTIGSPGDLLFNAIVYGENPVLFIENKLLYLSPLQDAITLNDFILSTTAGIPTYTLVLREAPRPILTMAAYGYMAELARQAITRLAYEHEIFVELIIPTQLAPYHLEPVVNSVNGTGRLLTVEEGTLTLGWGAEVIAQTAEKTGGRLRITRRIAACDLPVPSSGPLETKVLPGVDEILRIACEMVV
jgi:pyruvate/2-oxoglutarate/acetoin dehydrogenase E1 component